MYAVKQCINFSCLRSGKGNNKNIGDLSVTNYLYTQRQAILKQHSQNLNKVNLPIMQHTLFFLVSQLRVKSLRHGSILRLAQILVLPCALILLAAAAGTAWVSSPSRLPPQQATGSYVCCVIFFLLFFSECFRYFLYIILVLLINIKNPWQALYSLYIQ